MLAFIFAVLICVNIGGFFIAKSISKTEYNGNYFVHSFYSFLLALFSFIVLLILIEVNHFTFFQSPGITWYDYIQENVSVYIVFLAPSTLVFFLSELIVRKLIFKNKFIYVIIGAISMLALPLFMAYILDNMTLNGLG